MRVNRSRTGGKLTKIGLIFLFVGDFLFFITSCLFFVLMLSFGEAGIDSEACLCCNAPILLASSLIGYRLIYSGKREFSHEHENSCRLLRYLLFPPVVYFLLILLLVVLGVNFENGALEIVLLAILLLLTAISWELARLRVIFHLLDTFWKKALFTATALASVTYAFYLAGLFKFMSFHESSDTVILLLLGVPFMASYFVHMLATMRAYRRIYSGELQPRYVPVPVYTGPAIPASFQSTGIPSKDTAYEMMRQVKGIQLPREPEVEEVKVPKKKKKYYASMEEMEKEMEKESEQDMK